MVCTGAAGAYVVESIIHNQKKMIPCSVLLEGEYGESDLCIGVPVILGKNGIEKIVELELTADEKENSLPALRLFTELMLH